MGELIQFPLDRRQKLDSPPLTLWCCSCGAERGIGEGLVPCVCGGIAWSSVPVYVTGTNGGGPVCKLDLPF